MSDANGGTARDATGKVDVAVVGGGLAGLAAAAYLGRAGLRVTVLEKGHAVGGRATTRLKDGFAFNIGPHALYRGGAGVGVLEELGVRWTGAPPRTNGAAVLLGDGAEPFAVGPFAFLSSDLLPGGAKLELARVLWRLRGLDPRPLQGVTLRAWLDENTRHRRARAFLQALFRVSCYAADTERHSAGAAIAQLQRASRNVLYLDGGWQTLVDGLHRVAERAGVRIRANARVTALEPDGPGWLVRASGGDIHALRVLLTGSPRIAAELVSGRSPSLQRFAQEAKPVRAATLDVALSRLPRPSPPVALGLERPLYFSVHSASARLAPEGAAMLHVAKYLDSGESADGAEAELERVLDRVQPGWREALVDRRFLPHPTVAHALVEARTGGTDVDGGTTGDEAGVVPLMPPPT